ncbi:MAG: hypothetical protein HY720_17010 [Planctomycetes bacterium]|nr:hypothetical protein [Planctomycetota bacterium]
MSTDELLNRYCRMSACVYVETTVRGNDPVFCFQDFKGRRIYRTIEEMRQELDPSPGRLVTA